MRGKALADALVAKGAILDGHFRLSSGRHSPRFIQKFRILEDPALLEPIAREIASEARAYEPTVVVSAAVGGIVIGYEVARALGTRAIFVEKENGVSALRRGFVLGPGDRVLVVEDVMTTGLSVREVIDVVASLGATVVAVAAIVAREPVKLDVPAIVLLDLPVESFDAAQCPQCRDGEPISEPGSRRIQSKASA